MVSVVGSTMILLLQSIGVKLPAAPLNNCRLISVDSRPATILFTSAAAVNLNHTSSSGKSATMHPDESENIYFVATGNGGHKFTSNLPDHNRAVQEYIEVMRAKN